MIYILYGQDTEASYARLSQLRENYPNTYKIRLTDKNSQEDLYSAIFNTGLFEEQNMIICENYLASQKINPEFLKQIPKDQLLIFWEKDLTATLLSKIKNLAICQNFKPAPTLFWFLDAVSPTKRQTLKAFSKLSDENNLTWHLANRFLLLILAKHEIDQEKISKITGRDIQIWQWAKIENQSKLFNLQLLESLYSAILKIDVMIKKGLTGLGAKTLISLLFLKYLKD